MYLTPGAVDPNSSTNPPSSASLNEERTRSLPDEILAEIFSMGNLTIRTDPDTVYDTGVFTVMQVCRRWRCIAVSTPFLWSDLVVDLQTLEGLYDDEAERIQVFKTFTEACLMRSGEHPLKMAIIYLPSIQTFPWLIATAHRWKSLEIDALDLHTMTTFISFPGFPALRSLKVHSIMDDFPKHGPDLRSPQLASLYLPSGSGAIRRFGFTIATLTCVKVQVLWTKELPWLAKHLSLIPNMTQLHLSTHRPYTYHIMRGSFNLPKDTLFRLPKLQMLFLESTPSGTWEILSLSHLPSLVHLSIHECVGRYTVQPSDAAVRRFLGCFPGQLQSFSGHDVDFERFKAVLLQLKPRVIKFGDVFVGLEGSIPELVRKIVTESVEVAHVEHLSLYMLDASALPAFINILRDIKIAEAVHSLHASPLPPRKRIDLHVEVSAFADTQRELQNLLHGPLSRSPITVHCTEMRPGWRMDDLYEQT